ncbi:MAG: DUF6434 domain-containing protein [Actinomycetota bacterium]
MSRTAAEPNRPVLSSALGEAEFRRWYWTLRELQGFARTIGVSPSGRKAEVTERIAAALSGRPQPTAERPSTVDHLAGPLTRDTVVPPKQRATQELRAFFTTEIGPSFRFNGHMRDLLGRGNVTLGQAIDHWFETVGTELGNQSESLEFNRFTRAWHDAHPTGTPAESRAAWKRYRSLPTDRRPPIADA